MLHSRFCQSRIGIVWKMCVVNRKLQQERDKRHWSIDEASARIGVSRLTYIRWEQGRQTPHGSSLRLACRAFELPANQLGFGGPEIEAKYLTLTPEELLSRYDEEVVQVAALGWVLPQALLFDNSKWHLSSHNIHLHVIKTPYHIPSPIESRTHTLMEEMKDCFFDSTTMRLNRLEFDRRCLTLNIQKAHYFDYLATNYAMDACGPLRDVVHADRKLEPLETSVLSNHIGVSGLVFTSDGWLIVPVRASERVGIWHNMFVASISGATSFDDDIRGGLPSTLIREGRDELRLENADFGSITFLGMTRELLRGGKPEAYFAAQLTIPRAIVEQRFAWARDQWEARELQWVRHVSDIVQEFEQMSQSLQASVALWYRYVAEEDKNYGISY